MKNTLVLLCPLVFFSCIESGTQQNEQLTIPEIDMEAELAAIEETRTGFMLAIKEKRYGDVMQFATQEVISVSPICGDWEEYKRLRSNTEGLFSYDSIIMKPKETIIVSDSIAYDFGTSSVYYTNGKGEAVEITDTFLAIIKKDKQDGKWRLHREVATTNTIE